MPPTEAGTTTSYRPGCSDNVDFGLTFAENFLNKRYGPIGLKEELDKHNFRVGRHVSAIYCITCSFRVTYHTSYLYVSSVAKA